MADGPRFLLVRLDGLGDALACVPVLEGLRQAYPGAGFGAVCSPANAQAFSPRVTVHVFGGGTSVAALGSELRRAAYTHALVATEEVAGYELARASGASRRSGFWHRLEKPFKSLWQFVRLTDRVYRPAAWTSRPEHEVETLYRLALPFGAQQPAPRDIIALRSWLAGCATSATRTGALGFQVAAKLTVDGWGPAALAQLCGATLKASGLHDLTLLAAPRDQGLASALMEHLESDVRACAHLSPPAGVPQWLRAIDSLAALVTPDTGAAHAAGMLGVPVIDLFLQTRFDQLSRQWRPWAAPARCIVKPLLGPGVPQRLGEQLGAQIIELRALDVRP
ncbi:MAG TPA: glycosyltransferase family 9 protein [Candidatus Eremiobacteraceae bacterium]|nr:glycosyltransferase family 9 protein [Candidatus Eremiobacteraceae bacterium]